MNNRRFLPAFVMLSAVIALFAAWLVAYPYFLRWLEGFSFFCTLPDFTRIHYDLPADLTKYAGAFLLQFYSSPVAGALIQTATAVLFVSCIWGCVKRLVPEPETLMLE